MTAMTDLLTKSHIPGRLRLKRGDGMEESAFSDCLDALLERKIIESCDVNRLTETALIRYDASRYSMKEISVLLGLFMDSSSVHLHADVDIHGPVEGNPDDSVTCDEKNSSVSTSLNVELSESGWSKEVTLCLRSDVVGRVRLSHPAMGTYPQVMQKVELFLVNLYGVTDYSVSGLTSSVLIRYDSDSLQREDLIEELAEVIRTELAHESLTKDDSLRRMAISSSVLVLAGTAAYCPPLFPVAFAATTLAAWHIFVAAKRAVFTEKKIKVDILDSIVIGLGLAFGHVFAGAVMVWVVDLSDYLLTSSSQESRKLLVRMTGKPIRKVWKWVNGAELEARLSEIQVGEQVVVRAGEQVPVDGVVMAGEGAIDQQYLTGESFPVEKGEGDAVYAMTFLLAGKIIVMVERTGEETNASKITRMIEHSMEHKSEVQSVGERFADAMVLPTLGMSAAGFALGGVSSALAIINSDFGTGIRMAAPIALMASLSMAANHGIIIKDSSVLENFFKVDVIVFDKTGTLTERVPEVRAVHAVDARYTEEDILVLAAAAERRMEHPVAHAILSEAESRCLEIPYLDDFYCHVGFGIEVYLPDGVLKVGSQRFLEREGVVFSEEMRQRLIEIHETGQAVVLTALGDELIGIIEMQTSHRMESTHIIQNLRERGIEVFLLSGDYEASTKITAEQLGIDDYFAEVLPEQKADCIKMLQEKGLTVAMVGDGVNDAVALAQADFSISLRGATNVATDAADIVFMDGNLRKFEFLFDISCYLSENVKRSFTLILLPNVIGIVGAMFGVVGLTTSLLLNNGFNFLASINGMLPYYRVLDELELRESASGG